MRATLVGISLLFLATTTFAGDKGNGGYAVVCRDNGGPIVSAELLDIYEGRILYKRTYTQDKIHPSAIVASVIERVKDYRYFQEKLKKEITLLEKNLIYIPEGNELEPTEDAFPPIKKKGCEFEQVANYTDNGELLVSEEIFERFDSVNRAALIIHEAVYSMRRKSAGDTNSQTTRRLVAQLLSTEPDQAILERWVLDSLHRPNNKMACGLEGSIEERIEQCSYVDRGSQNFFLVMRTTEKTEYWYDRSTKLIWSDRLPNYHRFADAQRKCQDVERELGHIGNLEWRLPTSQEFGIYGESLLNVLPSFSSNTATYWFWTSTPRGRSIQTFSGEDGRLGVYGQNSKGSVRCVSKL